MKLVIITGISGSGKTTVARQLLQLGHIALDSNHPNDPIWKAKHKWVINKIVFDQLTKAAGDKPVYLCGGGDSLKALWPSAFRVFLLKVDAQILKPRLNNPSRDNAFASNKATQQILLNRLDKFQAAQLRAGAITINADQPIAKVVDDILSHSES